jgi:integration host factor subunit beta
VELRGFGTFTPRVRSSYLGRNPKTGTEVPVRKKAAPYFKASGEMHWCLNPTSEETASERAGQ